VVEALVKAGVIVSVDTWRAGAIEASLQAGAQLINDTSGLIDPAVADMAAASGAGLVLMHTRAAPKQEHFPSYADPVRDVLEFLRERVAIALEHGVSAEQIVIDPGLDYAKAPQESIDVLRRLGELGEFERPILLAVSRKYFIGMLADALPQERLAGTIAALEFGVSAGAQIVRVHDVAEVSQYLRTRAALRGDGAAEMLGRADDDRLKWIEPKG
jgi:dihydropteroate synthase